MKLRVLLIALVVSFTLIGSAWAAGPEVSNVRAAQKPGTTQVEIVYDLAHAEGKSSAVSVEVSSDGGATYTVAAGATGAVGGEITPGTGKTVTWNVGAQWPAQFRSNVRARVTAFDSVVPSGFALIPAGTFTMGDNLDESAYALPTHAVTLSTFYLAKTEVTWSEWVAVRDWGVTHGYPDLASVGAGKADTHPVQTVSWLDVVKWCNTKSEKDGLVPVYYTDDAQTTVYRTGSVDVTNAQVKWAATGYRLPTEAEWEYGARGGLAGKRFPWGDTITHSQANYCVYSSNGTSNIYSYDVSPTRGFHPTYATVAMPYTSPAGAFAANGYGLFDMAGNVLEWCWDLYGFYGSVAVTAPLGPTSGAYRVFRGGGWFNFAGGVRSADRYGNDPGTRGDFIGFRPARSSVP